MQEQPYLRQSFEWKDSCQSSSRGKIVTYKASVPSEYQEKEGPSFVSIARWSGLERLKTIQGFLYFQNLFFLSVRVSVTKSGSKRSWVLYSENVPADAGQHPYQRQLVQSFLRPPAELLVTVHLLPLLPPSDQPFSLEPSCDFHCSLFSPMGCVSIASLVSTAQNPLDFRHLEKKGLWIFLLRGI